MFKSFLVQAIFSLPVGCVLEVKYYTDLSKKIDDKQLEAKQASYAQDGHKTQK